MQNDAVRLYYDCLVHRKASLQLKRVIDILLGTMVLCLVSPVLILAAAVIKIDSPGPALFHQKRVTQYGKTFRIHKLRTMIWEDAGHSSPLTLKADARITKVGRILRMLKIDELPQLFNVLRGEMSLVGPRPEMEKYVDQYSEEMMATLLLPAGITSEASINYRNEHLMLDNAENSDQIYMQTILPDKMEYNMRYLLSVGFRLDMSLLWKTVRTCIWQMRGEKKERVKNIVG